MFRITSSVLTARRLLYCRMQLNIQLAAITRTPPAYEYKNPRERDTCPPSNPTPPPKPKEDAWLWGTLALLALTGAFSVYAKSNPEVRDWLTLNAPWIDDLIAVIHQENMTYGEFAEKFLTDTKKSITGYFSDEPPLCDDEGNLISQQEEEEECVKIAPPILTKDICEIETCLKEMGDSAIHNYMMARDACICYNKEVHDTMLNFSVKKLKNLHEATQERKDLVKEHVGNAICSAAKLDELIRYFECGVEAPKDSVKNTRDLLKEYCTKIKIIRIQWEWEHDKSVVMDEQWKQVEAVIDKYTAETTQMTKELDYCADKPHLRGDPDLLLHHTKRYVEALQAQLNEAIATMNERTSRGLESLVEVSCDGKILDEKAVKDREANLQSLYKKKLAEEETEFKRRTDERQKQNDKFAADTMKNLKEQQQKTLALRLEQKTVEATAKLKKMVAAQCEVERKAMAREKSAMAAKLKILQDKLDARLKAEQETRRSQQLWGAGYSLLKATKKGGPFVRVDRELKAIENASGDGDKLVLSVLKAIPDSVRADGVVPESTIRARYHAMEDVALKVALVEREGVPLPVYIISFIQALFLFMKIPGIPQKEYDHPSKEPSKDLDTYDLLQRARFWVDRGDIARALKYVDALEGASRAAADSWYHAARSYLETRQAAEAVLAHAAALGLQYI